MTHILDLCFENKERINVDEFSRISEERTSDMVLSVLNLLRERLPCSENYWRYKRNYEMHMKILAGEQRGQDSSNPSVASASVIDEESKSDGAVKKLAKAHMSLVSSLNPYKDGSCGSGSGGSRP